MIFDYGFDGKTHVAGDRYSIYWNVRRGCRTGTILKDVGGGCCSFGDEYTAKREFLHRIEKAMYVIRPDEAGTVFGTAVLVDTVTGQVLLATAIQQNRLAGYFEIVESLLNTPVISETRSAEESSEAR